MAYNPAIPNAGDLLSQSQADIKDNFTAIGTLLAPNGNPAVILPKAAGNPTASVDTMKIYAKAGTINATTTQLFIERESGSGDNPVIINFTEALKAANGYCILPCGIMLQWGSDSQSGGANNTNFNFTIAFPNTAFSITATPNNIPGGAFTDNIIAVSVVSSTQYNIKRKTNFGSSCPFNWFAVGN